MVIIMAALSMAKQSDERMRIIEKAICEIEKAK